MSGADEMLDGIVARALRELESQKASALEAASQVFDAAKRRIETLEIVRGRDVFGDALVVAVGDFHVAELVPGANLYSQNGNGLVNLTVVKSRMSRDEANRRDREFVEAQQAAGVTSWSGGAKLRAMLVILDDSPGVPPKGVGR